MNPNVQSFLLNLGIFAGILVSIAVVYLALLGGLGALVSRRWRKKIFRLLWLAIIRAIVIAVIALSLFIGSMGFVRGELREDWQAYASVARIAFFALYGSLVILGGMIAHVRTRQTTHGNPAAGITGAIAVLVYLIITLPLVEFHNACLIGTSFLLSASC